MAWKCWSMHIIQQFFFLVQVEDPRIYCVLSVRSRMATNNLLLKLIRMLIKFRSFDLLYCTEYHKHISSTCSRITILLKFVFSDSDVILDVWISSFNSGTKSAIDALEDIHFRASYDLFSDVLMVYFILNFPAMDVCLY